MRKSTKLISMLLAMVMVFSTVALGASAAYSQYKDQYITGYDSIDKPVFTSAQLASIALDAVDGMLMGLKTQSFKVPILNATIRFSSIDAALDSLQDIYNGNVWNTAKPLIGDLQNLTFAALNTDASGNFAAQGVRRTTAGKTDLDVIYSLLKFVYDNGNLLAKYGYHTLSLGGTIESVLGDSINEYLDAPTFVKKIIYDAIYDEPKYQGKTVPSMDSLTIDQLAQTMLDDQIEGLQAWANENMGYGITCDLSGLISFTSGTTYDTIENILKYAYNNILVPLLNTRIKDWVFEQAGLLSGADYLITDKKGNKVGYYLDDTAAFTALKNSGKYVFKSATSVYADKAASANTLGKLIKLDYTIPTHNFAADDRIFDCLNDLAGEWVQALFGDTFPWQNGSNDLIIDNATVIARELLKQYGARYLSNYITVPTDAEIDALTLEDAVIRFAPELVEKFVDNALIPSSARTVRSILSYAILELIAEDEATHDVYAKLESGQINPDSDEGWKEIIAVFARHWANNYTNMNIPDNATFDQTLQAAANWASTNYASILAVTRNIPSGASAWTILDTILFAIIPSNWLPATGRALVNGQVSNVSLASTENIIMKFLVGNVLDLKFEYLFDIFKRNNTSELNGTLTSVLLARATGIINAIIPDTIPTGLSTFSQVLTYQNLGDIIKNLINGIYLNRVGIITGALPIVCQVLGLTGDQELEDPMILYPDQIFSTSRSLNGTEITVRNNSSGVNTAYRDKNGTLHQDKLYQVQIVSITTNNSAVRVSNASSITLNGGESKTFPVTGSLSNDGLVRFCIEYKILDESGSSLTTSALKTYFFTYVTDKKDDSDNSNYEIVRHSWMSDSDYQRDLEAGIPNNYVDENHLGANTHYVINAPYAYVSSWGQLEDVSFDWGRETTDATYNSEQVTVRFYGFNSTPTLPDFMAPAEFTNTVTKYGGIFKSQDFFDVSRPKVEDEETGLPKDADFADYAATYDVGYTLDFGDTFGNGENSVYTVQKKVILYDDGGLASLASKAVSADRQASNYSDPGAFNTYLNALTDAEALVLAPKQYETFNPADYVAKANALEAAIEALDATAQGAGVEALVAAKEAIEPSNAEDAEYDDAGYHYFGSADYVLFTWNRYRDDRRVLDRLVDSQTIDPDDYETPEEYNEALENIPSLSAFQVSYAKHMYEMNAGRLIRKTTSKAYLQHSKDLIGTRIRSASSYSSDTYAEYTRALAFANTVLADNSSDLRQTKVNEARYQLVKAFKNLTDRKNADYTQLDQAIASAAAYLDLADDYTEASFNKLLEAYLAANAIPRNQEGTVAFQTQVDEAAQALLDAIDKLVPASGGGDEEELGIQPDAQDVLGVVWEVSLKELNYGDYYVDGLCYDNSAEPSQILTGNIAEEYVENPGTLTTGDYVVMDDGTIVYFVLYGDVFADGVTDGLDITEVVNMITYDSEYAGEPGDNPYITAADLFQDYSIDVMDISIMINFMTYDIDPTAFYQDGSGDTLW